MVDKMKIALEEAQANLTIKHNRVREYANEMQREEEFQVGD